MLPARQPARPKGGRLWSENRGKTLARSLALARRRAAPVGKCARWLGGGASSG